MGDVAMTVPVVSVLRDTYPELKITILTKAFFKPLFSKINDVTVEIAEIDTIHKGIFGLYKLSKFLKSKGITHVADLHNVLRSNILKYFFKISGIPIVQVDKGRSAKKGLIESAHATLRQLKTTHQRYADVFAKLNFPVNLDTYNYPKNIPVPSVIHKIVRHSAKKWVGIAPFAQYKSKTYPLHLITQVVAQLNEINDYEILLFGGGKRELKQLEDLETKYDNAIVISNKIPFAEEINVIANLDVMVAMDSGNAHIAANFNLPVITLWGATHPSLGFAPFQQPLENCLLSDREKFPLIPTSVYGNKVPAGYDDVMKTIPPQKVVDKILEVIKQ